MDDLDDVLAAARPDPEPAEAVTARHRARLLQAMQATASAAAPDGTPTGPEPAEIGEPLVISLDARRPRDPYRWGRVAAAVASVAALTAGAVGLFQAASVDAPTFTASTPDPTTSAPQPEPVAGTCGAEPPFALTVPDGYDGPIPGASPNATTAPKPGQVVVHWSAPTGTIELRWPAYPSASGASDGGWIDPVDLPADDDWHMSGLAPEDFGPWAMSIAGPWDGTAGPQAPPGMTAFESNLRVNGLGDGDCREVSLTNIAATDAEARAAGSELHRFLMAPGGPLSPEVPPLVTESAPADAAPLVMACQAPAGVEHDDYSGAQVSDLGTFPTPADALQALIDTTTITAEDSFGIEVAQPRFPLGGYHELHTPDGTVAYINDIGQDGTINAVFTAVPVEDGWTISEWTTSGC